MPSRKSLLDAFKAQAFFEDKTWRLSPEAWVLNEGQMDELEQIGQACLEFYQALNHLYNRSSSGESLLRNQDYQAPWVAEYYDRGKPEALIAHARSQGQRNRVPVVIRPDLLITESGFVLTELDSVPGGIGLTAFLGQLYFGEDHSKNAMIDAFYKAISGSIKSEDDLPVIAIVVSDESATYRPEMDWLSAQLRTRGKRVYACHPDDLSLDEEGAYIESIDGISLRIDGIYRFWELFDHPQIPQVESLLKLEQERKLTITPPAKPMHEEKLSLALYWNYRLKAFWQESLSKQVRKILDRIIPETWIVDPRPLPPGAYLDGPYIAQQPMGDWSELKKATKRERNLIIKISGFDESAWGARSVTLGSDVSQDVWSQAIDEAMASEDSYYICQRYHKPARLLHPLFKEGIDEIERVYGRVRLCPYYFVWGKKVELKGALSTFCPADKKIIHGMTDAALLPTCGIGS